MAQTGYGIDAVRNLRLDTVNPVAVANESQNNSRPQDTPEWAVARLMEEARSLVLLILFVVLSYVSFHEAFDDADDGQLIRWRSLGDGMAALFFACLAVYQYLIRRAFAT
jgi:hypothetical protein